MKPESHMLLEKHLKELGLGWISEFRFHDMRRWRFDYLLMGKKAEDGHIGIAVEIEGAIWSRGRHTRGKGYEADCMKYSTAAMMGYRVLRFTTNQVIHGIAKDFLKEWLCGK